MKGASETGERRPNELLPYGLKLHIWPQLAEPRAQLVEQSSSLESCKLGLAGWWWRLFCFCLVIIQQKFCGRAPKDAIAGNAPAEGLSHKQLGFSVANDLYCSHGAM